MGFLDGQTVDRMAAPAGAPVPEIDIANTQDDRIYQTERYGMSEYAFDLPNGNHTVRLHFAETYSGITGPGQRVFSVNVEGVLINNLDIFAEAGGRNRALVKTAEVQVNDGQLNLVFTRSIQLPEINGIEILEGHGSITVNSTEDTALAGDGKCTLREAINNANSDADTSGKDCLAGSGADTIKFSVTGTIGLGSELPAISKDLTISGPGASSLTISGDSDSDGKGNVPILTVNPGVSLALDNLTLAKGVRSDDVGSGSGGGGIRNNGGTLTVTNSTLSGNSAGSSSPSASTSTSGFGGGIYNNGGTLSISNSTFSGNGATISYYTGGNGGGIYNKGGTLSISNSNFSDNRAGSDGHVGSGGAGGGIYNEGGTLTISNSTFSSNSAGSFYSSGGGGGIFNGSGGTLSITNSSFSENSTFDRNESRGGGIYNEGTLSVTNSTFSNNSIGIYNNGGTLAITNTTFSGNSNDGRFDAHGGGIRNNNGTLTITNSTFSGNSANRHGPGSGDGAFGGGIYNEGGTLTISNSTFSSNSASLRGGSGGGAFGGGIYNKSGTLRVTNTIIAKNTAATGPDCAGALSSEGHNLIGDSSGCSFTPASGDLVGTGANPIDPKLGPLQDNGGPTQTHALLEGSPAIDAGDSTKCPTTDQRGVLRPQGKGCDIGAYELQHKITTLPAVTIEAEQMTLGSYVVDPNNPAWIRLPEGASSGTASASFSEPDGTYKLNIHAIKENDGQPTLELWVDGALQATFTYPLGTASFEPFVLEVPTLTLNTGTVIELLGQEDDSAFARLDKVEVESPIQKEWVRQFGSPLFDAAQDVVTDGRGNVYLAGNTLGALPGQSSAGDSDAYVRKYNSTGNELWTRQFGTSLFDEIHDVAVDTEGKVYVIGNTLGALPGQTPLGGGDAFVRKYDSEGNEVWTRQFGSADGDGANNVAVDQAGNVYVVGSAEVALPGQTHLGASDAYIRKYDSAGNELWTRQFGTSAPDGANGVVVDTQGKVYVVGDTYGTFPGQTKQGLRDTFIRKYDSTGNELWTRQFADVANDAANDTVGNLYVVGRTLRKYDSEGNEVWSGRDGGKGVKVDVSGKVFVVGATQGREYAFIRQYDSAGTELLNYQFGTFNDDGASVAVDIEGKVYVVGNTFGTFSGQTNAGGLDAFAVKFSVSDP